MRAKIIRIEKVDRTAQKGDNKGKKFTRYIVTCDVVNQQKDVKRLKWDTSDTYMLKYLNYCGIKSIKDIIGEEVSVVVARRMYEDEEGVEKTYTYIKFLNLIDENGEIVIMPKDENL